MHSYAQSTGAWSHAGAVLAHGYSGHGAGVNCHALQAEAGIGPIPVGRYILAGIAHDDHTGPFSIIIAPCPGTEEFGRAGFRCHGDNQKMNHSASEGCIILPHAIREQIWASGDHQLEVVP